MVSALARNGAGRSCRRADAGKASSYLINGIGSANWRTNMIFISLLAVMAVLVTLLFVDNGPFALPLAPL